MFTAEQWTRHGVVGGVCLRCWTRFGQDVNGPYCTRAGKIYPGEKRNSTPCVKTHDRKKGIDAVTLVGKK